MDRTYSCGTCVLFISPASITILPPRRIQLQPRASRILIMQAVSWIFGTLVRTVRPLCRRAAAISGRAAFFDPCMEISPFKGMHPLTRIADKRPPPQRLYYTKVYALYPLFVHLCFVCCITHTAARIWLDTLSTIPISTIRNRTDVPP